jgi:hypothetical protein
MEDSKRTYLQKLIDWTVSAGSDDVRAYVQKLRRQNPGISDDDLARKIVGRKAFKNGLVGAATGLGGLMTLPVTVPVDLALSWRIQVMMALSVACVYGHSADTTDLKTDIYIILAGNSAKEALKRIGIETSKTLTKKAIQKYVTREIMKKIWKVAGRKVVTKAGQKSVTSFVKWIPLVGALVGFAFDWTAARTAGEFAIKYYRG